MGDWKELILKTGVDKLLEIIASTGEITLGEASRQLGVKPSIIESWADALADDKMITTSYNAQGELVFRSTKANLKVKEGKIDQLKKEVDTTIKTVESDLDGEEKMLDVSKSHIRSFEQVLKSDINHIEIFTKNLKRYDSKKSELMKLVNHLKTEQSTLEKQISRIDGQEKKILAESDNVKKTVDAKVVEVAKSKENIIAIEKSKDELKRDFEVLRRISNAIRKAHPEDVGTKIEEIEKRTGNLKTHNSLVKQKFEKLNNVMHHLFK